MAKSPRPSNALNLFGAAQPAQGVAGRSLEQVFRNYIQHYAYGPGHTARAKRADLKHFLAFLLGYRECGAEDQLTVADWDQSGTQRFVDELLRRGQAPATVARRLATIKHMGRTLAERVPGFVNPAREIKPPRFEVAKPKALRDQEIARVKERASERVGEKRSFTRVRNETILHLLLDTGLRAEEIRLLRREQLDDSLEWLSSVRTKGRRYRNVYVTSAVRPRLRAYLEARSTELKRFFAKLTQSVDKTLPIFISVYKAIPSKPESFVLGAKTLWRAVRECSAELDLHPHLLRHSFALELLDHSGDIRLVSQALGHGDTKVTMRYTERRGEEVARALEKVRAKKTEQK